jgi:hypothetical protein
MIDLSMLGILQGLWRFVVEMIGRLSMLSGERLLKLVARTVSLFLPLFPSKKTMRGEADL